MRFELIAVHLELFRVLSVRASCLNQIEQDLLENDQEDHESVDPGEGPVPVCQHEQASKGDE